MFLSFKGFVMYEHRYENALYPPCLTSSLYVCFHTSLFALKLIPYVLQTVRQE